MLIQTHRTRGLPYKPQDKVRACFIFKHTGAEVSLTCHKTKSGWCFVSKHTGSEHKRESRWCSVSSTKDQRSSLQSTRQSPGDVLFLNTQDQSTRESHGGVLFQAQRTRGLPYKPQDKVRVVFCFQTYEMHRMMS